MGVCLKRTLPNSNFLTTHAGHMKFSWWANMKKHFPKRGSPKLKLFNLLKWIHEMVVSSLYWLISCGLGCLGCGVFGVWGVWGVNHLGCRMFGVFAKLGRHPIAAS